MLLRDSALGWLPSGGKSGARSGSRILVVAYSAAAVLWIALAHGLVDRNNKLIGTDFSNVYAAGTLALADKPDVACDWRHFGAGADAFHAGPATQMRRVQEGKSGSVQPDVTIPAAAVI